MKIAIIGPSRLGSSDSFRKAAQTHTRMMASGLTRLGHHVVVFAGPQSVPRELDIEVVPVIEQPIARHRRTRFDPETASWLARRETAGYRRVIDQLADRFDVVHNASMHASVVDADLDPRTPPMVHVLHGLPADPLAPTHERLARHRPERRVVATSAALALMWGSTPTEVIADGIDTEVWRPVAPSSPERRTQRAVWVGRIAAATKPDLAIDAARRLGWSLTLAGTVHDPSYFDDEIRPRLDHDVRWVEHLSTGARCQLYADCDVGVLTGAEPAEPLAAVAAQMSSCGLPIAALGGAQIGACTDPATAVVTRDGADRLAAAMLGAAGLDRAGCRGFAESTLSLATMLERYTALYGDVHRDAARRARVGSHPPVPRYA